MKGSPSECVIDTNVLVDLHIGGLLDALFRLPIRLLVPDLIIAELETPKGTSLAAYGLESCELSGDQLVMIMQLREDHRRVSVHDLAALLLA